MHCGALFQRLASLERLFQTGFQRQGLLPSRLGVYANLVPHSSPHILQSGRSLLKSGGHTIYVPPSSFCEPSTPSCLVSHLSLISQCFQHLVQEPWQQQGMGWCQVPPPSFLSSWQDKVWPIQANNLLLWRGAMALLELQTSLLRGATGRSAPEEGESNASTEQA